MISRRAAAGGAFFAALSLSSAARSVESGGLFAAEMGGGLRERASRKGLLIGSAVDVGPLASDPLLRTSLAHDCNILVPENGFNWTRVQPTPTSPLNFAQADAVYAFATANRMAMRGHNLVWYETTPRWVDEVARSMTIAQVEALMTSYVDRVASAWSGRLIHQEVVNEPVTADGLRPFVFANRLGEAYIDQAFHVARQADPHALLFINQELIEMDVPYQAANRGQLLRLVDRLLRRGVPIQAVGIESHLDAALPFSPRVFQAFLDEITAMGLPFLLSEFDISDQKLGGSPAQRDLQAAALAKTYLDLCFSYRNCLGMLDWSHSDKNSWLRKTPGKQRLDRSALRPDLLDDAYNKKPMWGAVAAALDAAPGR